MGGPKYPPKLPNDQAYPNYKQLYLIMFLLEIII